MKVCLITTMTPASENIRGTSALPYHLIKGRSKTSYENETLTLRNTDATNNGYFETSYENEKNNVNHNANDNYKIDIEIYTFNNNNISDAKIAEVEKLLEVTIKKVPLPKWFRFVFKYHLLFIRLFLKYPIHHYVRLPQRYVDEIKSKKPDLIWVYGAEWSLVVNQFEGFQRIHTLPDSEALYYYRMLGQRFVTHDWKKFLRCAFMYPKFLALERDYSTDSSIHYHLVGEEDANFLKKMNPGIQAHFIRHPHYEISKDISYENETPRYEKPKPKRFHQPKIKLLIAGQYNLYMKQSADELLQSICRYEDETFHYENESQRRGFLQEHYSITFLGKGWEKHVEVLKKAGYDTQHIPFVENYQEELIKHDIQITPITIGTGTKGKVLDALANGLMVIGTPYAMENIAVKNGESCIEYRQPEEVIKVLMNIPDHREYYEQMAIKGRETVLTIHGRETVSKELFSLFKDNA